MRLRIPPGTDPFLIEWGTELNVELGRREAVVLGTRLDGGSLHLRFRCSPAALFVQVHVQPGSGAYDPQGAVFGEEVDCRADRLQDVEVEGLSPGAYIVYLVPVEYNALDERIVFDGQDERPDFMSFEAVEVA